LNLACLVSILLALTSCANDGVSVDGTTNDGDPMLTVSATEFSDEFSSNSLSSWTLRHQTEGEAAQYTVLDINQSNVGMLTIQPTLTPGWFADGKAPLIYKRVTGNFSVETSVTTRSVANAALPPGSNYNSAGLMVRSTENSDENYVMVNVGRQLEALGTEAKETTNSISILNIQAGSNNGRLTLCRVGADFYAYRQLDNETEWTRIGSVNRNDIPETVQVGMVVNGFTGPDIVASFDYIRMQVPNTEAECTVN
jgi:hypothetical protein